MASAKKSIILDKPQQDTSSKPQQDTSSKPKSNDKPKCTCCGKPTNDYYLSKSDLYKDTELLTICKGCVDNLYERLLKRFNYDMDKAIYYLCMKLDMPFHQSALAGAKGQIEKSGGKLNRIYITKINSFRDVNLYADNFLGGERLIDSKNYNTENQNENDLQEDFDEELTIFWGYGFELKDYAFLETELANWQKTHKCDNQAEVTLLKEICIKILEIRKKRALRDSVSKEQKDLQELMKTASVDPAKANIASAGKSQDAFGLWVKDIEQFRPAEWFEQQEKYKDMDGFVPYIKNYIVRPIENFLTNIRNFVVDDNIDADLDNADINTDDGDFNG